MSAGRLSSFRAEDIIGQVRQQLRRDALFPTLNRAVKVYSGPPRVWGSGSVQQDQTNGSGELAERLLALYRSLDGGFAASVAEIGEMPAVAPTLRGTVGRIAIGFLQRLMWWYTGSLRNFARSVGTHLQGSTEAIEVLLYMLRANQIEIEALREEVRRLRAERPEDHR